MLALAIRGKAQAYLAPASLIQLADRQSFRVLHNQDSVLNQIKSPIPNPTWFSFSVKVYADTDYGPDRGYVGSVLLISRDGG
jgi:hypothetical protein